MTTAPSLDIGDQSGRTFVVTGANSGIGLETARRLTGAGARVVLACRSVERGGKAAEQIGGDTAVRELDTSSLQSIDDFVKGLDEPVDVLVNNAGIMATPEARSVDGFEMQLATNFLGPFALTAKLLPKISDRVVMVSSLAHLFGRIDVEDLNWRRRRYSRWGAYGQSKLADLLFTNYLQGRLSATRSAVRAVSAHPGLSSTNLMQGMVMPRPVRAAAGVAMRRIGQPAPSGALPTLFAATAADVPGGSFVGPSGFAGFRGAPELVNSSSAAKDRRVQRLLIREAERLTGAHLSV